MPEGTELFLRLADREKGVDKHCAAAPTPLVVRSLLLCVFSTGFSARPFAPPGAVTSLCQTCVRQVALIAGAWCPWGLEGKRRRLLHEQG